MANEKYSTNELEELLNNTEDVNKILEEISSNLIDISPGNFLRKLVATVEDSNGKFLDKLNISTSYFYDILNNRRIPGRDVFLQFLIVSGCNFNQIQDALKKCGYRQLYSKNRRDAVIIHTVMKSFSLAETDILLDSMNLSPLQK